MCPAGRGRRAGPFHRGARRVACETLPRRAAGEPDGRRRGLQRRARERRAIAATPEITRRRVTRGRPPGSPYMGRAVPALDAELHQGPRPSSTERRDRPDLGRPSSDHAAPDPRPAPSPSNVRCFDYHDQNFVATKPDVLRMLSLQVPPPRTTTHTQRATTVLPREEAKLPPRFFASSGGNRREAQTGSELLRVVPAVV